MGSEEQWIYIQSMSLYQNIWCSYHASGTCAHTWGCQRPGVRHEAWVMDTHQRCGTRWDSEHSTAEGPPAAPPSAF